MKGRIPRLSAIVRPVVVVALIISLAGCNKSEQNAISFGATQVKCIDENENSLTSKYGDMHQALLASRFKDLEELEEVIDIQYGNESGQYVQLSHCSKSKRVTSILDEGIDEGDFRNARDGDFLDKLYLLFNSPFAVKHRKELKIISEMARRKPEIYGVGDVAFYDLAENSVTNVYDEDLAKLGYIDTTEKGLINTFNHITAQALVTTCFSEQMADYIADAHERFHMPELLTGKFRDDQLIDKDKNPMDNYVDIINNEWGQEIGKRLKTKYGINDETIWSNALLTQYLNDLQEYYSWSFKIGFKPYKESDIVIIRFVSKLNHLTHKSPLI